MRHTFPLGNTYSKGNTFRVGKKHSPETIAKFIKDRPKGENHHAWKGGRMVDKNGYVLIRVRNHPFARKQKYLGEHRLVVEKHIGRYLLPTERVHHINKNPADNRIENLMVFKNDYSHMKYAFIEKGMQPGEIIFDGRVPV